MTNHALSADAIGPGGAADGSQVIADGNGDRERVARAGEQLAPLSDVRSVRGIA